MGRRRATRPDLSLNNQHLVEVPVHEKSVHKRVPAVVHWADVEGTDRTDDETIGEAIVYDDGTSDVIVWSDISPEAKKLVAIINGTLDHLSIQED